MAVRHQSQAAVNTTVNTKGDSRNVARQLRWRVNHQTHNCCADARVLWFSNDEWIFDTDDGLRGPVIQYCPWCGELLPAVKR